MSRQSPHLARLGGLVARLLALQIQKDLSDCSDLSLLIVAVLVAPWGAFAEEPVSFVKQVAPILVKQCLVCHGAKDPKGEYQLHTYEVLRDEGIENAKPDNSELYNRLVDEDPEIRMPKDADKLPDDEIALIKRWISEGGKFDGPDPKATLASIIPKQAHPKAPEAYSVPVPVTAVAFSPDGKQLAVGGYHEITIWNPADGKLVRRIGDVAQRTYGLAFSADGKLLAAASGTPGQLGEVRLYNPADGALVNDLATMTDCAFAVSFSPKGDKLASAAADRSIRVFDVASGKQELLVEDHADWVMGVAWSADGAKLASASRDKTSKVFDAKTGEAQATYNGHNQPVFGVAFNADGKQLFTSAADRQIHTWNPADGKKIANIAGFGNEVYQLVIQNGQLFSCSADKTARHHDATKRNQVRSFAGHNDWVFTIAVHTASKRLASGSFDGEVRVWNTEDGKQVVAFTAAPGYKPPAADAQAAGK